MLPVGAAYAASVAAVLLAFSLASAIAPAAHAQDAGDVGIATFHESVALLVDRTGSQNVTASVTLQSVSTYEMQVPERLEERMRQDGRITAVIVTNHEQCVLGVSGESCILVNTERDPAASNIAEIQESAREVADRYIGEINGALDTDAAFHSVFVHAAGRESNVATGLPGTAAGRTTVSVVYVMTMEDTHSMFQKMSAALLAGAIRDSGGFYDAAVALSAQPGAKMSFSIVPLDSDSLMQLKVIAPTPTNVSHAGTVRPLEAMGLDALQRSGYFASGFYPLNSVVQVAILSADPAAEVSGSRQAELPTSVADGEKVPTMVDRAGWVFDPKSGKLIQAKYLFGTQSSLAPGDLEIEIRDADGGKGAGSDGPPDDIPDTAGVGTDEQIMVVIAVVAVAAAAAIFYMRGYSGRPRRN